jgi:hypothetical protein
MGVPLPDATKGGVDVMLPGGIGDAIIPMRPFCSKNCRAAAASA